MNITKSQERVIAGLAKNFKIEIETVKIVHIPAPMGCNEKNISVRFPNDRSFLITKNGRIIR